MGDAEYMISNGLDPFMQPNGDEWEGGNPLYENHDSYRSTSHRGSKHSRNALKTYDDWLREGRHVKRGETKVAGKGRGSLFSIRQTLPL